MITKRVLILLFMVLLVIPIAISKTEYPNIGGVGGDFDTGDGIFGASANFLTRGVGTTGNTQVPLVVDLDGDGTFEIIIIDSDTIRLFNSTLGAKDSLAIGVSGRKSNMIIFDIDGDGKKEMIVAGEANEIMTIVEWNGTDLFIQSQYNWSNPVYHVNRLVAGDSDAGEVIIACEGVQKCLMAVSSQFGANFPFGNTTAVSFNETQVIDFTFIASQGSNGRFCAPYIKTMDVADLTGDGSLEYIWSWFNFDNSGGSSEEVEIYAVNLDSNLKPVLQSGFPIIITGLPDESFSSTCESQTIGKQFSPPTVFNAFGGSTNQIFVAFMNSFDTFKIFAFSEVGVFIDDFPEFIDGESKLISNVFRGNFFPDSGNFDFCAAGYDNDEDELEIVCGSLLSGEFPETNRYIISVAGKFEVDQSFARFDVISHSTNHDPTQSQCLDVSCSASNLDEVLTPYGIHRLVREGFLCDTTGTCELEEIFNNPFNTSGVFISVDTTEAGSEDLLLLTNTNLFLFDSLFLDQPAEIDRASILINPCIDSAWQINSTGPIISFKVDDQDPVPVSDLDQVFGQVLLYADSTNEQESVVQGPSTSGTTFFFDETTFNINKTTGAGVIRLLANDTGGIEQDIVNIPFTVSESGLQLGECVTEGFGVVIEDVIIIDATLTDDATDNAVTTGINTLSGLLGLGGTTIWLIIMIAISIGVWGAVMRTNKEGNAVVPGSAALGLIGILNLLMIVIGARLGILSTALIVIISIVAVVIIGVFLGRFLTGLRSGAG